MFFPYCRAPDGDPHPEKGSTFAQTFITMSYAEAVAELEAILAQLQEVPADIDQLHARVARAEQLITACRSKLRGVEDELAKLRATTEN